MAIALSGRRGTGSAGAALPSSHCVLLCKRASELSSSFFWAMRVGSAVMRPALPTRSIACRCLLPLPVLEAYTLEVDARSSRLAEWEVDGPEAGLRVACAEAMLERLLSDAKRLADWQAAAEYGRGRAGVII